MHTTLRLGTTLATAAIFALMGLSKASAAVITQNITFSTIAQVNSSDGAAGFIDFLSDSNILTANQFDPGLGTLDSISIGISGLLSSRAFAEFFDNSADGAFGSVNVGGFQELRSMELNFRLPSYWRGFNFSSRQDICSQGSISFVLCQTDLSQQSLSFGVPGSLTNLIAVSHYVGSGTVQIDVSQGGRLDTVRTDNDGIVIFRSGALAASGSISLAYNYTPAPLDSDGDGIPDVDDPCPFHNDNTCEAAKASTVPEPATGGLLAVALLGLIRLRSRQRSMARQ